MTGAHSASPLGPAIDLIVIYTRHQDVKGMVKGGWLRVDEQLKHALSLCRTLSQVADI